MQIIRNVIVIPEIYNWFFVGIEDIVCSRVPLYTFFRFDGQIYSTEHRGYITRYSQIAYSDFDAIVDYVLSDEFVSYEFENEH